MVAPSYVSENSPRAIRGLLIGFYQLFETMGAMVAFFIDYGSLLHIKVCYGATASLPLANLTDIFAGACELDGPVGHAIPSTCSDFCQHPLLSRIPSMAGQQR